jgi:hypothetical protein
MQCISEFWNGGINIFVQNLGWILLVSGVLNVFLLANYWLRVRGTSDRASRLSPASSRQFWPLIIFLISVGSILIATGNEFLKSLGHAALIAGVLAGTVDLYLKERLLKEILVDASKFLIGYELPTEIKDRIKELITTPLIRRDFSLRYQLIPGEEKGFINCVLELSFEIDNLSHRPQKYQQAAFSLENSPAEEPQFLEYRCDSTEPEACYVVRPGANGPEDKIAGKELVIPPHNRSTGRRYTFFAKYSSKKREQDSDFFVFYGPSAGLTVTVEGPSDLAVSLDPKQERENENHFFYSRLWEENETVVIQWSKRAIVTRAVSGGS